MTQKEKVLDWLQKNGTITSKEAIYELGITQLATRITELSEDGHNIRRDKWKKITDRDGKAKKVRVYEYVPPGQQALFGDTGDRRVGYGSPQ